MGQAVWQWDNNDPFGSNAPNENPSGLGDFTCNLRFPGQYFDKETNLHYNYFRDYDPAIGRYIQADPIGILGLLQSRNIFGEDTRRIRVPGRRDANLVRMHDCEHAMRNPSASLTKPDVNLYGYVTGNPLSLIDPLGLFETQGADGKYDAFVCMASCSQQTYGQSFSSLMAGGAATAAFGFSAQGAGVGLAQFGGRSAARQLASRVLFSSGTAAVAFGVFNICYGAAAAGYCGYVCDTYYNPANNQ
jgi:RHS repeat-associated protein